MQWFHDRGTLAKLLGSFTVVCAVMAVVGWMGLSAAQSVKSNLDGVGKNDVPGILSLAKTRAGLLTAQRDIRTAVLVSDRKDIDTWLTSTRTALADADKAYAAYAALHLSDAEKALAEKFVETRKTYGPVFDQALAEVAKGTDAGDAAASDILVQKALPQAKAMNDALAALLAENEKQTAAALQDAQQEYDSAVRMLIGVIGAGVLLALGIGFYVARSLATPLKAMTARGQRAGGRRHRPEDRP